MQRLLGIAALLGLCLLPCVSEAAQATFGWVAPVGGTPPTSYQVQRCQGSLTCTPSDLAGAVVNVPALAYVDLTIAPGTLYCYAVTASAGGQASVPSPKACGTSLVGVPNPPTGVTLTFP